MPAARQTESRTGAAEAVALDERDDRDGRATELPPGFAAVATLLPRATCATVGVIVAFTLIRGAHGNKNWDRAAFIVATALVALLGIQFLVRPPRRPAGAITSICASAGLLVGIACSERPELKLWGGFGLSVALTALCIAIYLWRAVEKIESSRTLRAAATIAIGIVAVCDFASLIRTLSNFVDTFDNAYVLNEMLAPVAGRVPGATSVPQYVGMYGWVLVPFRHVLSARDLASLAMLLLSCFAVLSVVLAVAIAARCTPSRSVWISAAVIIPLTCVTVGHGTNPYSSIASYTPELPIRIFPAMLLSFLGLEALERLRAGPTPRWHLPALGALAGLIVWNSQDFGIAVTVAFSMVLAIATPPARVSRSMLRWTGGVLLGLVVYPVITGLAGAPINASYFALFSRAFASGLGQVLIQARGPVLVVLPLILASSAIGWCLLWRGRRATAADRASESPSYERAALTLALVGTWALGGSAYYLNRSYASAFLQVLLMPSGVCVVALLSLAREARAHLPSGVRNAASRRISLSLFPVALLSALGVASLLQSPNPGTTVNNLAGRPYTFDGQLMPANVLAAAQAYVKEQGGTLGYFGNNGNYLHLEKGLSNVLLFDDPQQLTNSAPLRRAGCRYLEAHATAWVITSPTDADAGVTGPDICGSYRPVIAPGLPPRTLFAKNVATGR